MCQSSEGDLKDNQAYTFLLCVFAGAVLLFSELACVNRQCFAPRSVSVCGKCARAFVSTLHADTFPQAPKNTSLHFTSDQHHYNKPTAKQNRYDHKTVDNQAKGIF